MSNKIHCPNCNYELNLADLLSYQTAEDIPAELREQIQTDAKESYASAIAEADKAQKESEAEKEKLRTELEGMKNQSEEEKERDKEKFRQEIQAKFEAETKEEREALEKSIRESATKELNVTIRELELERLKSAETIDGLQQQLRQGSQRTQGEAQELEIEDVLKSNFPDDKISEVPTGARGADIMQTVFAPDRGEAGTIVWEVKKAKKWSNEWLPKVRKDKRDIGGDIAAIVSSVLPKEVNGFEQVDGVWVVDPSLVIPLTSTLRMNLIAVYEQNKKTPTDTDALATYVGSTEFKNRIEGTLEPIKRMRELLDTEKRQFQTKWAKQDKEIEKALNSVATMYGEFQSLAGNSVLPIDSLEMPDMPALEEG